MPEQKLTIGFARRGYSSTGGAEAYLKRLAEGIVELGHAARLFTTSDWPEAEWPFGEMTVIDRRSPIGFANELDAVARDRDRAVGDHAPIGIERDHPIDVPDQSPHHHAVPNAAASQAPFLEPSPSLLEPSS